MAINFMTAQLPSALYEVIHAILGQEPLNAQGRVVFRKSTCQLVENWGFPVVWVS
jgi:hypothetical protein